jgi:hypothetical protein
MSTFRVIAWKHTNSTLNVFSSRTNAWKILWYALVCVVRWGQLKFGRCMEGTAPRFLYVTTLRNQYFSMRRIRLCAWSFAFVTSAILWGHYVAGASGIFHYNSTSATSGSSFAIETHSERAFEYAMQFFPQVMLTIYCDQESAQHALKNSIASHMNRSHPFSGPIPFVAKVSDFTVATSSQPCYPRPKTVASMALCLAHAPSIRIVWNASIPVGRKGMPWDTDSSIAGAFCSINMNSTQMANVGDYRRCSACKNH